MRNGLRRWQKIEPVNEQETRHSFSSILGEFFSVFSLEGSSKLQIVGLFGVLLTLSSSYFNFMGYSLLKAKLEYLGFDYVIVDSISFSNIYQAISSLIPSFAGVLTEPHLALWIIQISIMSIVVFFTIWLTFLLMKAFYASRVYKRWDGKNLSPKAKELLFISKISIAAPIATIIYSVLLLGISTAVFWCIFLLSIWGIYLGEEEAKSYLDQSVCVSSDVKNKSYAQCRTIVASIDRVASRKEIPEDKKEEMWLELKGKLLYQNDTFRYFLTNNATYTLNIDNKVIMSAPLCHYNEDTKSCKKDELKNNGN